MRAATIISTALLLLGLAGCGSAPQAKKKTAPKKTAVAAKKTQPSKAKPKASTPREDDSAGTPVPLGTAVNEPPAEPLVGGPMPPLATSPPIRSTEPPPPDSPPEDDVTFSREDNLKFITIAFHSYRDVYRSWPVWHKAPQDQFDKDGRPLLSWRVHILSQLENAPLLQAFHLNEPWDSEHNIKLLEHIPAVYASPGLGTKTTVLALVGPGAFYEGKTGTTDLDDGSENTIMLVDAAPEKAVPWTKPDDLVFDPKSPKSALGKTGKDHFLAGLVNGAVVRLRSDLSDDTFTALITRSGGEKVNAKDFIWIGDAAGGNKP